MPKLRVSLLATLLLVLTLAAPRLASQAPALLFGSYMNAAKAVQVDSAGKLKVSCDDCGGSGGTGTPGGATNTVQYNAGSGNFGGVALNTTATKKYLQQVSSGVSAYVQVAVADLSGFGTNVAAWLATPSSANLAAALTDETGSGLAVFGTSPTIVTPTIASFANATHNHSNSAGGGQIAETAFSFTNITTANATSSAHGLMPKGSGSATDCYLGDLTVAACPSGSVSDATISITDITTNNASTSAHGWMKKLSGNAFDFTLGDGTYGHTVARGTITTSDPWLFTQTWNASGTVFDAFDINITRTASADQSYYFRVRNGTGDVFAVKQNSTLNTATGCIELNQSVSGLGVAISTSANNTVTIVDACGNAGARPIFTSVANVGGNILTVPQIQVVASSGGSIRIGAGAPIQWSNTSQDATATKDTGLIRSAAGVVEVNNGTTGTQRDLLARHLLGGGTAPTAGTCATSPGTPAGADEAGRIAVGTSPSNTCIVNFGTSYTTAPVCFAENETTSGGSITVTETTSAMTLTQFALSTGIARNYTAADSLAWHCKGY